MNYTMRGTLYILPMGIYVNDNSMANILSLKKVSYSFRVTMDTKEDHTILVHYSKDRAYCFKECVKGLYYLEVSNPEIITLMTERKDTEYSFLYNVNVNMKYFTRADIEVSDRALDLQHLLGWLSDKQLINALSKNLIINCPVLSDDVSRAHAIDGPYTDF